MPAPPVYATAPFARTRPLVEVETVSVASVRGTTIVPGNWSFVPSATCVASGNAQRKCDDRYWVAW